MDSNRNYRIATFRNRKSSAENLNLWEFMGYRPPERVPRCPFDALLPLIYRKIFVSQSGLTPSFFQSGLI